jgi:hypothetical protein
MGWRDKVGQYAIFIPNLPSAISEDHLNFPSMAFKAFMDSLAMVLGPGEKSKTSRETHLS